MPRAANPFDYRTIADVLITPEYTALQSFTCRQQVIQQFSAAINAERAYSMREHSPVRGMTCTTLSRLRRRWSSASTP